MEDDVRDASWPGGQIEDALGSGLVIPEIPSRVAAQRPRVVWLCLFACGASLLSRPLILTIVDETSSMVDTHSISPAGSQSM